MRLRVGKRRHLWVTGVKAVAGEDLVPAAEAAERRWMPESGEAIILGEGMEVSVKVGRDGDCLLC